MFESNRQAIINKLRMSTDKSINIEATDFEGDSLTISTPVINCEDGVWSELSAEAEHAGGLVYCLYDSSTSTIYYASKSEIEEFLKLTSSELAADA